MIVTLGRWWYSPSGETYGSFIDTLRANGFLMIDVESLLGFDAEIMTIPGDGHWSEAGHKFVAKVIREYIDRNQLLGASRVSPTGL